MERLFKVAFTIFIINYKNYLYSASLWKRSLIAHFFLQVAFLSVLAKDIDFFPSFKKESENGFKNALDTGKENEWEDDYM